jgi:hypothetical protein
MHNFGCLVGLVRISHTKYTLPLVPNACRDFGWISLVIKYKLVLKVVILEKTEPQLKEIKFWILHNLISIYHIFFSFLLVPIA